jgi:ABC-type multidrug transport system fused ATPase/permease subunit
MNFSQFLQAVLTALLSMAYILGIDWRLGVLVLASVPFLAWVTRINGKRMEALGDQVQTAQAKATAAAEESFSNVRTVKYFSQEDFHHRKYSDRAQIVLELGRKVARINGLFTGFLTCLVSAVYMCAVLWVGGILVLNGTISTGVLTSYALYAFDIGQSLSSISGLVALFMQAAGASTRIFEILDRVPAIPRNNDVIIHNFKGFIQVQNVKFAYPTRQDVQIMKGLSIDFPPGTVTALVGPSGHGKSTLASLLERLYDLPSDGSGGRVLFDGLPLASLDLAWLHSRVAIVPQEPALFDGSVLENLLYGSFDRQPSQQEVESACLQANALAFIRSLPLGFSTPVGERGSALSGGQRQRLAIARAVLANPTVLICDEATSALDAESEALVQEALQRLVRAGGRTVIVIAHRLSTVRAADRIAVIRDGRCVELGTHDQLMEKNGAYAKLVRKQLMKHEKSSIDGSIASEVDLDDDADDENEDDLVAD